MVLADSHTISKRIYSDDKVDNNIYESIHDVDRPTNTKTRIVRQHKYKLYSNKEEDVAPPDSQKKTKAYELDKTTAKKIALITTEKLTTDHAKPHTISKTKVGFWKKLRGKDKKKQTKNHDPNERKRRISNHKNECKKNYHIATNDSRNPDPKTKDSRKNRKKFSLRQPELKISKRDAAGTLFSTRPYSNIPQSFKLQMATEPQVDNMLKNKFIMQSEPLFTAVAHNEGADNIIEQLDSKIVLPMDRYGTDGNKPSKTGFPSEDNLETSRRLNTKTQEILTTPELDLQVTEQLEAMLNNLKAREMQMASFEKPLVTGFIKSSVTEATFNYDRYKYNRLLKPGMPAPRNTLSTYVSIDDIQTVEKGISETAELERTDETAEYNLNDSIFSANTESHYIAARSIGGHTMVIAQNVEDKLQKELMNLYNKVKHKVSKDLSKEVHTVKSTLKESYKKFTAKHSSKCKAAANATRPSTPCTNTKPTKAKPKTLSCVCKTTTQKKKLKSLATTTSPRVKKKDDKNDGKINKAENITPDTLYAKTYDDYVMLTLYEQMLAKTHDENMRQMFATSEYPVFPKIKRESLRLSKRNPETLTDIQLKEVIQNLYDDGSNMPDYDYIDPSANVTSTGRTTAVNYNELDYVVDSTGSSDISAQDPLVEKLENNNKGKGTASAPAEADTTAAANNSPAVGSNNASAAESGHTDCTLSDTSYEGLSNKICYNKFVNGYKHYLKFQQDQSNQNFSNLVKYQAHRHHSVDDIGKYILNKIPTLPTYNKRKREQRFSDDSDNNMDYQEITTKSEDSWFKKHFYLFIDNGPPKKYHTSETVELKPTEPKLYLTEPTSRISQTEQLFVKIDSSSVPRKAKEAKGPPNLNDLSKVLDSIKKQQSNSQLSQEKPKTEKDASMPLSNNSYDTDDATQEKSFISKLFAGKRRNAPKKGSITTVYFPTTHIMFADSIKGRLKRSITKDNVNSTMMPDFMTKEFEDKASTDTKELFVDTAQIGGKETNKYGYVDIDLVPRPTAVVKLRDVKKSRFKNFLEKFHFKKKKDPKPKRSCYYNSYSQNPRRGRFSPIKKLKAMFSVKEVKNKQEIATEKFPDYEIANIEIDPFKPVKFVKPMSLGEMQKQVPNISDTYFEPSSLEKNTISASQLFGLDDKDEEMLDNLHPSTASSKQSADTLKITPQKSVQFSNATLAQPAAINTKIPVATASSRQEIIRGPSCNVMTVNVKTVGPLPSTTLMSTEPTSLLTVNDMGLILDKMQTNIQENQEESSKLNTMYDPSQISQTKYEYKKNTAKPLLLSKNVRKEPARSKNAFDEIIIKSKMKRIAKFPIAKRRNKMKTHHDSESIDVGKDYSGIDGSSILGEMGNTNAPYERMKQAKGISVRKSHHPHQLKPYSKDKDRHTDYYNDLLIWHNDILNMATVPNLQSADAEDSYTTPNMNKLVSELYEMKNLMNPGLNQSINMFPYGSLSEGSRDHVGARALLDQTNEQGVIRNVAMQDNALVTSDDIIIRGEAKYYQFNKAQMDENKLNASDLIKELNRLNFVNQERVVPFKLKDGRRFSAKSFENYPESTIIIDTTLLAYDDDVDSLTKALELMKKSRNAKKTKVTNKMHISFKHDKNKSTVPTVKNSQKSSKAASKNKMGRPAFLRTNSAPMQYYTTPLPMKSKEFNEFLKENDMDVDFVTSPLLDLPTVKDWTAPKRNWSNTVSTTNDILTAVEEAKQAKPSMKGAAPATKGAASAMQEAVPFVKEAAPSMKEAATSMQATPSSMQEPARAMQVAAPPMQDIVPPMQEIAPPMQEIAPPVQEIAPSMQEAAPSMQEVASSMQDPASATKGAAPAMQEAVPFVKEAAPSMKEAATSMQATPSSMQETARAMQVAAPPMQDIASPMQEIAPPMQEIAPPVQEIAPSMQEAAPGANKVSDYGSQPFATWQPMAGIDEPKIRTKGKPKERTTETAGASKQFKSKLKSFTKALSNSVKFTSGQPNGKLKQHKPANVSSNNLTYWDYDFDRYKRYTEMKMLRNTEEPTQEANYYSIFKKKMKETLFEKKATPTTPLDRLTTNTYTNPQNKEVEITIINFDDLEKITSQMPYETFSFPAARREEISTFGDLSNIIKSKNKTKTKATLKSTEATVPNGVIHNELLFNKDAFNEHNVHSTTSRKEYSTKYLSKSSEYVNPGPNDGHIAGTGNKMRYPFEKMPIYPNILSKVPQHVKNFNSIPKRVHISSHHYKYDIFYDDMKNTANRTGIEGFQPKLIKITTNGLRSLKVSPKPTPASETEAKTSKRGVKNIDRTVRRNRNRRRVWGSEAPHKKRKHFTFRRSKLKTTGGLTAPILTTKFFKTVTVSSAPETKPVVTGIPVKEDISAAVENTTEVSRTWQTETMSSAENIAKSSTRTEPFNSVKENYDKSSSTWPTEPLSDIEDVITLLDKQDTFEDAVTQSAMVSEFFTHLTFRDTERRALTTPSPPKTTTMGRPTTRLTTTGRPTTRLNTTGRPTTKATTTGAPTKATTTFAATTAVVTTSQPGSLVYDLKQLKPATSPKPSRKGKQASGHDKERHRMLFNILQNRFKSIMKNLTANTKLTSVSPVRNVTTGSLKISKRTCIIPTHERTLERSITETTTMEEQGEGFQIMFTQKNCLLKQELKGKPETTLKEHADENEGFKVSYTPDHTCPTASEPEDHPPAHHQATSQYQNHRTEVLLTEEPPAHGSIHHHYHHLPPPAHTESEEPNPTAPPPPATHRYHTTHRGKAKLKGFPKHHELSDSVIYLEPEAYDDQQYYEQEMSPPPISTATTPPDEECDAHSDYKREATPDTYTAKDVAALEVIVDLMKNTLSYEENNMSGGYQRSNTFVQSHATKPIHPNGSTNAIQVHIAIPFEFQNGKKRSPSVPGPVRVRKVFCAKMSTPVDLEYQVHSFEGTIPPTSTRVINSIKHTEAALSPGMYLLVDKPRKGYGLKPILGQINLSDLKLRQVAAGTTASILESKTTETREETTNLKSLAKVTLSKDFVAAVNQQLIELYENMSRVNKDVKNSKRSARSIWKSRKLKEKEGRKRSAEKYIVKRGIDWEAVKNFFGHDRVCNCKCKSNTAMCRACAASDAVIDELIFEFDNIGRYMADHCTEIQTFFWMNPIGGQRLRESVNKIDKSLTNYYKRVKGKCNGRKCKTFTTYIDKRRFTKTFNVKKEDSMRRLMNDLAVLAEDLNRTISLEVCYNEKLKESGDKFIHLMKSRIMKKTINKRSNPSTTPKKLIRNVYSLEHINVNIICHPESSTTDEQKFTAVIPTHQDNSQQMNDHLFDFDLEEMKGTKHMEQKGLKKLFPSKSKKSKLFSYFEFNKEPKMNYKRQVDIQVATPLISDGGGTFWYDYLRAGSNEPRLVRDSIKDSPHNIERAVVQEKETSAKSITESPSTNNLVSNLVETKPEKNQRDIETTTDTLSQNIKQMLQLFGSLQDVETMNNDSNRSIKSSKNVPKNEKESKHKKTSLISKVKKKMASSKNKTTTSAGKQQTLDKNLKELKSIEHELDLESKTIASKNRLKNGTRDLLDDIKSTITTTAKAMVVNTSTFSPTTKMISVTGKIETTNSSANNTTVSKITSVAHIRDKTETKPRSVNKTTTKSGFMNKLKAATKLFRKQEVRKTETLTTTVNCTELIMPPNSGVIDIVTDVNNKVIDYVIEESAQSTTPNPTIVIINEYGNQINGESIDDKEQLKNLLLSIIQFETNNLNDEWNRVAYAGDKHKSDADMKRSIVVKPKVATVQPTLTLMATTLLPPTTSSSEDNFPEFNITTKQPEGLLNKLVSKMGMKVANNKKKVVKKASIREIRKDRKNFIKNRKLRINSYRSGITSPTSNKEARDTRRAAKSSQICDIQATYDHLKNLQKTLPAKTFEMVARNITCYKHENADAVFVIPYKRKGKRWDWIRNKRSSKLHFYDRNVNFDDEAYTVNFDDDPNDLFERYAKGDDGIYKIVKRRKRTANLEALERGLTNIPALVPREDELFVLAGDSVIMDCNLHTPVRTCSGNFLWKTDRNRMLKQDNVYVDDVSLTINNVEPKNVGTYTCSLDRTVRKNVRLNVLTIPSFDVVFLPVYKTQDNCSYDDLKAIQRLGSLMAKENRCGKSCSVRIDEPVCQKDKGTNSTLVRVAAVISMAPRELNCSLHCKRDVISSLVMLCATNTAVLSSIKVLVSKDGVNETLTPWRELVRPVVTHTLRKKDTNGHHEYHKLVSLLSPGKVDVVLICPAGYYLLPKYKLCSACPSNTCSKAGDNTCRSCPRGTRAEPGAATCHLVQTHPRRYDWWWYPPCGYVVACCGVLFGCTACVLLSLIVHLLSRDAELRENEGAGDEEQKTPQTMRHMTVAYAHIPGTRPLSPSRVILPRFFKPSLTSSRATDSQETKFELWKERNRPPPLPPIDFDP